MSKSPLTRRRMLKGLGGLTLALPWLEQLEVSSAWAQSAPTGPKRVIVVSYQMGIPAPMWRPSAEGSAFTLPYVTAPLEAFKSRCLFVSELDHAMLSAEAGGVFGAGHQAKCESALTGTFPIAAFPTTNSNSVGELISNASVTTGMAANGESVEQRIGRALKNGQPFDSIDLCVDGDRSTVDRATRVDSRFFFESRGTPVSMDPNPASAFARWFGGVRPGDTAAELAARELKARNKSVLDAVRQQFADLRRGLGTDDQRRLDEHAARIRHIELSLPPAAGCVTPTGIGPAAIRMDQTSPMQVRLLAQAMACNLAPVGRLDFVNSQNPLFGIAELDALTSADPNVDWHAVVHGIPLPGTAAFLRPGYRPEYATYDQRLLDGYRFHVQQFANLLAELDRFPEGAGTSVLDNSLVILATDFGDGIGHWHMKKGYIFAGNLGPARRGFHFRATPQRFEDFNPAFFDASRFNVNQLLNSVLDMAGVRDAAGQPIEFGLRGYLAKYGVPRRIDGLFS